MKNNIAENTQVKIIAGQYQGKTGVVEYQFASERYSIRLGATSLNSRYQGVVTVSGNELEIVVTMTMGQALDEAIQQHESKYPGSKVYAAYTINHDAVGYEVEIEATHFSQSITYNVGG